MAGHNEGFNSFDFYGGELEEDSQQLANMIDNTVRAILEGNSSTVIPFSQEK